MFKKGNGQRNPLGLGLTYRPISNTWQLKVKINGVQINIGNYSSLSEAQDTSEKVKNAINKSFKKLQEELYLIRLESTRDT